LYLDTNGTAARRRAPKWTKAGSSYLPAFSVARGRVDGRTFARDEQEGKKSAPGEGVLDQRLFQCAFCRKLLAICRACDHGEEYCPGPCREASR
jgi:hypothetical protein